jgi:hypothetical protein
MFSGRAIYVIAPLHLRMRGLRLLLMEHFAHYAPTVTLFIHGKCLSQQEHISWTVHRTLLLSKENAGLGGVSPKVVLGRETGGDVGSH